MCEDPKSAKKIDNLTVFFALLGFVCLKAVCRTLMKLIPDFLFTLVRLLSCAAKADRDEIILVSISPTIYVQIFCTNDVSAAFSMYM